MINTKNSFWLCFALIFILVSGCTPKIRPLTNSYWGADRVFTRNYEIGQKITTFIGQPMVIVKNYKGNRHIMRASHNFKISGGIVSILGDEQTDYLITGEMTIDEEIYAVVNVEGPSDGTGYGALVKSDGSVHKKLLNGDTLIIYPMAIDPPRLRFITKKGKEIKFVTSNNSYELSYGGTDGKSLTIAYKEYTSINLTRPTLDHDLVYKIPHNQIRLKDTVLKIHELTDEKIIFTVISDDLNK